MTITAESAARNNANILTRAEREMKIKAEVEAFLATRANNIAACKNLRQLGSLWERDLEEASNLPDPHNTFKLADVQKYAPKFAQGERPLPVYEMSKHHDFDLDEVIAWDDCNILFGCMDSFEANTVRRMSMVEMIDLIRRAAQYSGWGFYEQRSTGEFEPLHEIAIIDRASKEIKFIGSPIAGTQWAMPIVEIAAEEEELRLELLAESEVKRCEATHGIDAELAAFIPTFLNDGSWKFEDSEHHKMQAEGKEPVGVFDAVDKFLPAPPKGLKLEMYVLRWNDKAVLVGYENHRSQRWCEIVRIPTDAECAALEA